MPNDLPRCLTAKEVASQLRVSPKRVYELVREGHLPGIRLGERQVRVSETALREFVASGGSLRRAAGSEVA